MTDQGSRVKTHAGKVPAEDPRVSIGMPVYNGERYLREALDSILAQSFADFELVISDNSSTDGTEQICKEYAARDARIRYHRNERNIGGANNENLTFNLSRGEFFRWAAHDDVCAPDLIGKCVEVLEKDPTVVLSFPHVVNIDENGKPLTVITRDLASSEKPNERFRNMIALGHHCEETYGLIRSETLRKTKLQQNYTDSDRTLIAELSLYGKFRQIPEPLFFRRIHPQKSTIVFPDWRERMLWFDPTSKGRIQLPHWMQFFDYLRVITRSPLPLLERMRCYSHMAGWLAERHGRWMVKDLLIAAGKLLQALGGEKHVTDQLTAGVSK